MVGFMTYSLFSTYSRLFQTHIVNVVDSKEIVSLLIQIKQLKVFMDAKDIVIIVGVIFAFVSAFQIWRNKCNEYNNKRVSVKVNKAKIYWPADFHTN